MLHPDRANKGADQRGPVGNSRNMYGREVTDPETGAVIYDFKARPMTPKQAKRHRKKANFRGVRERNPGTLRYQSLVRLVARLAGAERRSKYITKLDHKRRAQKSPGEGVIRARQRERKVFGRKNYEAIFDDKGRIKPFKDKNGTRRTRILPKMPKSWTGFLNRKTRRQEVYGKNVKGRKGASL